MVAGQTTGSFSVTPGAYFADIIGYYKGIEYAMDYTTYGYDVINITAGSTVPLTFYMTQRADIYRVATPGDWAAISGPTGSIATAHAAGRQNFIIDIVNDITIPGYDSVDPNAPPTFFSGSGVIGILGNGRTLTLASPSDGPYMLVNAGAIMTIRNLHLVGSSTAMPSSIVVQRSGGELTLTGTSSVSGHTANATGGGVFVNGGIFILEGNASIHSNNANVGGGVYVAGGTFEMKGGTIRNNTASTAGGGVYVFSGATFTKTGGHLYGLTDPAPLGSPTDLSNILIDDLSGAFDPSNDLGGHALRDDNPPIVNIIDVDVGYWPP
jgi:hypothetical protein